MNPLALLPKVDENSLARCTQSIHAQGRNVMNTMNLFRHHVWLQRLVAGTLTAALALGSLHASAQGTKLISGPDEATTGSPASEERAIDPAALDRAHAKLREAAAIANRFVPEATAAGLSDGWRMTMITNLMKGSRANFANVASAQTLTEARLAAVEVAAAGVGATGAVRTKDLGSVTVDLVFLPISPCRIIDTTVTGTPMTSGEQRNFVTFAAGSQGVTDGNCVFNQMGTAINAKRPAALAANISVLALSTSFTGIGYLAAYPQGGTPNTAFMTYKLGDVISNAGIIPISQNVGNAGFTLFVSFGAHVKMDVFGVFVSPEATALDCTTVVGTVTTLPANSANTISSAPACATGFTQVGVLCGTSSNFNRILGTTLGGCFSANESATAANVTASSVCCRTPGR